VSYLAPFGLYFISLANYSEAVLVSDIPLPCWID
jgi:hypothetical protein